MEHPRRDLACILVLLLALGVAAHGDEERKNEVTVEFNVQCNANGELDAEEGTTVRMEVVDNQGNTTTLTYTFPQGSHARAITKYFADALRAQGFEVEGPEHDDGHGRSTLTIRNVKSVKVGTSLDGKLPVTFTLPPPPPPSRTPTPVPRPVATGRLPRIPTPKPPPPPTPPGRTRPRPTTLPPHGPGSIQILITQGSASGGRGGTTTQTETISVSATQGSNEIVLKHEFEKGTPATEITKYFHDQLVAAGFDLKPYQPGDTQLFFNKVSKLDGAYSSKSARTTFGWGETPITIDDRKSNLGGPPARHYRLAAHYAVSRPRMDALNDYIAWINTDWDGDIPQVRTLQGFDVEGIVMLTRHLGLGAGYRRLAGSAEGRSRGGRFGVDVDVDEGYLLVLGEGSLGTTRFHGGGEVSLGYAEADYAESEESWKQTGKDSAIEYGAGVRGGYELTDHLSLDAEAGYRGLMFDGFDVRWVSAGEPPVELDLSGLSLRLGLAYAW